MAEQMAGARHTRPLNELRAADAAAFGGKSASLGELIGAGFPVPPGFAISTDAGERMSDELRDEIAACCAELAGDQGEGPLAVRSSALGEDSAEATFAGQQDTFLWVRGVAGVCDAVQRCWASLHSAGAVAYREHLGGAAAASPAMGVIVQAMIDAAVAGVMFTCNPVTGDPSMIAINASWGLGLAVVGGEVTPDDHLISKVTGEVVRETIAEKEIEYVPDPAGSGTVRRDVEPDRRTARCLDTEALRELVALGRRIERHFGAPQDVEWAIDRSGRLFVLQSRPVTGLPDRAPAPSTASAMSLVMKTFGAGG
ncbi:MAG: PEP/pyruvate-binding domain-containing protein [Solirubrobacteraceae bacterium]